MFDQTSGHFLGMPVRPIAEHVQVPYELLVLASFDRQGTEMDDLIRLGVAPDKILPLRPAHRRWLAQKVNASEELMPAQDPHPQTPGVDGFDGKSQPSQQ